MEMTSIALMKANVPRKQSTRIERYVQIRICRRHRADLFHNPFFSHSVKNGEVVEKGVLSRFHRERGVLERSTYWYVEAKKCNRTNFGPGVCSCIM